MNHGAWKVIAAAGLIAMQVNIYQALAGDSITNWTWTKGTNIVNQHGIYGTQGVPDAGNTPGAREFAAAWTGADGALWLFGGQGYDVLGDDDFLGDLWKYDPATVIWTWMKGSNTTFQLATYGVQGVPAAGNLPGARRYAASWTGADGALWLFGGDGCAGTDATEDYLNDLWKYDPGTGNWTWMKGSTNWIEFGTYGIQGVPAAGNTPGAREYAVSRMDSAGALWLFGGYGYASTNSGALNDLWKYDPGTGNWTWMKGSKNCDEIGTYGTQGVPAAGNTPGARGIYGTVSWVDSAGALWLFGGYGCDAFGAGGYLNDLWKYDPGTGSWTWMKGPNTSSQPGIYGTQGVPAAGNTPGARSGAVSWTDGAGALWLFGGFGFDIAGNLGCLNDLWKYDPATGNWTWIKGAKDCSEMGTYGTQGLPAVGNEPGARSGAASWTDGAGALWLFGGIGYDSINYGNLNDLWKYDPLYNAIANVVASDGTYTNKVLVTWSAAIGATGYRIFRHTSNNSAGAVQIGSATSATYDDLSAAAGTTYYYWVKAANAESAFSAPDSGFRGVVGPLITANGLVGDVYLNGGEAVTIAVQMMNIEPYLGAEVDWWVVAFAHSGAWYYLDSAMQWASFSGDLAFCRPVYQGPLFNVPSTPVLNGFTLPSGTYDFWFAVDYPMDGILNLDGPILYDCVTVVAQ